MDYNKFVDRCKGKKIAPSALLEKMGISTGNLSSWKKGGNPSMSVIQRLSEELDCSIDYLNGNESVSIQPKKFSLKMLFDSLMAFPQRASSIRRGKEISTKKLFEIAEYTNSSPHFLFNENIIDYYPDSNNKSEITNPNVLFDILDIMDKCSDSDAYTSLQVQLSRIVLYNIGLKNFSIDEITKYSELSSEKMNYIYTGKNNVDKTLNYGLNYSDLSFLREKTGLSYQYMFTGIETDIIEQLQLENAELRNKLNRFSNR